MNEMESNNRYYDEAEHGYRSYRDYRDYRDNYRDNYRGEGNYRDYRDGGNYRGEGNYRDEYNYRKRDYDRRGGKINYRGDYYEDLEMVVEDMREQYRTLEDISEMISNPQEKNVVMKVAQTEKQNYQQLKQIMK